MSNANARKLAALFDATEVSGDWGKLLSTDRTRLVRQKIVVACRFPRSSVYQNRSVAELIEEQERLLLEKGIIKTFNASAVVVEATLVDELYNRLHVLQQRGLILEQELHVVLKNLQKNEA